MNPKTTALTSWRLEVVPLVVSTALQRYALSSTPWSIFPHHRLLMHTRNAILLTDHCAALAEEYIDNWKSSATPFVHLAMPFCPPPPTPFEFHDQDDLDWSLWCFSTRWYYQDLRLLDDSHLPLLYLVWRLKLLKLFRSPHFQSPRHSQGILKFAKDIILLISFSDVLTPDTDQDASQTFFDAYNFPLTRVHAEKLGVDIIELSRRVGNTC